MTNEEKFKTAEERQKAYAIYCESMRSANLAILPGKFEWLGLEYDVVLRVCPFCGGEATVVDIADPEYKYYHIRCSECACKTEAKLGLDNAISAWNRRVK